MVEPKKCGCPTNKLPLLGGGERELQDGDRVRLGCGRELTIRKHGWKGLGRFVEVGIVERSALEYFYHYWEANGLSLASPSEFDIVLILGPAEETHGDGTVTRVKTVLVKARPEIQDRISHLSIPANRVECPFPLHGKLAGYLNHCNVTLTAPPTPSPTYTERLIEAVRKGECQLPFNGDRLEWSKRNERWIIWDGATCIGPWIGFEDALGPLPLRQSWDPTEPIDLVTVQEAAEVGK